LENRHVLNHEETVSAALDFWSALRYAVIHPERGDR